MRNVEVVQQMIDWMEEHMEEGPTLQKVSQAVGYSPWYCSCMFHDVTGMTLKAYVTSMDKMAHPIVTAHTAGWKMSGDKKIYFYGTGVLLDYAGEIPAGFEIREIPASDYLVFSYPVFDFMSENADVMGAVENLAFSFDPTEMGYEWNEEECQIYQRHYPEKLGYQVVRPVRKMLG